MKTAAQLRKELGIADLGIYFTDEVIIAIQRDAREGISKELEEAKVYIEELEQERSYVEQALARPGEHGLPFTVDRVVHELKTARAGALQALVAIRRSADISAENRHGWALQAIEALRAKYPNLFTK